MAGDQWVSRSKTEGKTAGYQRNPGLASSRLGGHEIAGVVRATFLWDGRGCGMARAVRVTFLVGWPRLWDGRDCPGHFSCGMAAVVGWPVPRDTRVQVGLCLWSAKT